MQLTLVNRRSSADKRHGPGSPVDKLLFLTMRSQWKSQESAILVSSEAGILEFWCVYGTSRPMGRFSYFVPLPLPLCSLLLTEGTMIVTIMDGSLKALKLLTAWAPSFLFTVGKLMWASLRKNMFLLNLLFTVEVLVAVSKHYALQWHLMLVQTDGANAWLNSKSFLCVFQGASMLPVKKKAQYWLWVQTPVMRHL